MADSRCLRGATVAATALTLSLGMHWLLVARLAQAPAPQREPPSLSSPPLAASLVAAPVPAVVAPPAPTPAAAPARMGPSKPRPRREPAASRAAPTPMPAIAAVPVALAELPAALPGDFGHVEPASANGPPPAVAVATPPPAPAPAVAVATPPATAASAAASDADPRPKTPLYGVALPAPPQTRTLSFAVHYGEYAEQRVVARVQYTIRHDDDRYELRSITQAAGLTALLYSGVLSQRSVGRLGADGFEPLRYVEQRGNRPERQVEFDYEQRRLDGLRDPVPLPPGTQDRLSMIFQLGLLVRALPEKFAAGTVHSLPLASMRRVDRLELKVIGDESLRTPQGDVIDALRVSLSSRVDDDDPRLELWLGYDVQMLPVRIRIEDPAGRVLDQLLQLAK